MWVKLRTKDAKETKVSDKMALLILFNYQGALTVGYHKQCSFYRRRLFAAYGSVSVYAGLLLSFTSFQQSRSTRNLSIDEIYHSF